MRDGLNSPGEVWGPLILRLTIGIISAAHGAQRFSTVFGGPEGAPVSQTFQLFQVRPDLLWPVVVGVIELVGGLALLRGMLTRLAAGLLTSVAAVGVSRRVPHGLFLPGGIEHALALFGASLAITLGGAGRFSLDRYFERLGRPLAHRRQGNGAGAAHRLKG